MDHKHNQMRRTGRSMRQAKVKRLAEQRLAEHVREREKAGSDKKPALKALLDMVRRSR